MRRGLMTVLALLMIANVFTAYAIVPVLIAGAVLIGSGIGIGLWLGHEWWGKPAQEKVKELEQQLTKEKLENLATLESASLNTFGKSKVLIYDLGDAVHYGRNYAWALAKYQIIKALEQGDTLDGAMAKAKIAVFKYYLNVTRNIIEEANNTAEYLNFTLNKYINESKGEGSIDTVVAYYNIHYKVGLENYVKNLYLCILGVKADPVNIQVLGKTYTVLKLHPTKFSTNIQNIVDHKWLGTIYFQDSNGHRTQVYDWNVYQNVLNQINNNYKTIIDNINAYVQGLKGHTFNTTDLIDPYVLATFLDKDWNKTGYYGYAAAELALLGMTTTGLNKTITIDVNGKKISGFLFTDWTGKLEVNKTYTIDKNHIAYIVADENGQAVLIPLHAGTTFKVVDIRDWQGRPLNSTTLINYDPHSGDVQKIYDELKRIELLYEDYLNNLQTTAGGSWSGSISEWWNGLDTYAKLGVIAIGCVAVYALFRRR